MVWNLIRTLKWYSWSNGSSNDSLEIKICQNLTGRWSGNYKRIDWNSKRQVLLKVREYPTSKSQYQSIQIV